MSIDFENFFKANDPFNVIFKVFSTFLKNQGYDISGLRDPRKLQSFITNIDLILTLFYRHISGGYQVEQELKQKLFDFIKQHKSVFPKEFEKLSRNIYYQNSATLNNVLKNVLPLIDKLGSGSIVVEATIAAIQWMAVYAMRSELISLLRSAQTQVNIAKVRTEVDKLKRESEDLEKLIEKFKKSTNAGERKCLATDMRNQINRVNDKIMNELMVQIAQIYETLYEEKFEYEAKSAFFDVAKKVLIGGAIVGGLVAGFASLGDFDRSKANRNFGLAAAAACGLGATASSSAKNYCDDRLKIVFDNFKKIKKLNDDCKEIVTINFKFLELIERMDVTNGTNFGLFVLLFVAVIICYKWWF